MPLLIRFNLIFAGAFAIGLAVAAFLSNRILQESAQEQVIQNAKIMMETALSTRTYTVKQVAPLLHTQHTQISALLAQYQANADALAQTPGAITADGLTPEQQAQIDAAQKQMLQTLQQKAAEAFSKLPKDNPNDVFYPQTVPAYAATESFNYLREKYPEYTYKEATLNPTNPQDRTTDWEADIVGSFRNDSNLKDISGLRATPNGNVLYLARPLKVSAVSCLECHSTPDKAPAAMIKIYGSANGFGWKQDEIIGAQIVQVPISVPVQVANKAFWTLITSLLGVFLLTFVLLNIALIYSVIRPVAQLSAMADEVSKGKFDHPEFQVRGKDEISVLANSFNRMRRSLNEAIKMLQE